jgi:hypothetical protein
MDYHTTSTFLRDFHFVVDALLRTITILIEIAPASGSPSWGWACLIRA